MSTIGERLKSEREKVGKSQIEFGELGGVKRQTQLNYESGKRSPDADYLAAVADTIDVQYVVTGLRTEPQIAKPPSDDKVTFFKKVQESHDQANEAQVKKPTADYVVGVDKERLKLSIETLEEALIETHRKMTPAAKADMVLAIYDFYQSEESKNLNKSNVVRLVAAMGGKG